VDLTNVTLSEALRIVGTIAGTFYKPITPNTIFVAQNNQQKHGDLDDFAVQTFYLSNASQPNDGNEIITGLRLLLSPTVHIYLVPSQNAVVVRGTTDQLLLAQKLIADFDRARPEVVVDVAILEVNRDKIRNLGITLPQSIGLTPQASTSSTRWDSGTRNGCRSRREMSMGSGVIGGVEPSPVPDVPAEEDSRAPVTCQPARNRSVTNRTPIRSSRLSP